VRSAQAIIARPIMSDAPTHTTVLAGDIGGTHARLARARIEQGRVVIDAPWILGVREHPALEQALAHFLGERDPPTHACLAWAGPIEGGRARLTNGDWSADVEALEARFGFHSLRLVNDFHAAAHGVDGLSAADLATLQSAPADAGGARLVIGAGTGLGVAYALRDEHGSRVVAGEGGHVAFAPLDDEQAALWRHLQRSLGRVTAEHVVSGAGIVRLHGFCCAESGTAPADEAADVARRADAGEPEAQRALRLFCSIFGAVAGDHALSCLATGGVFVAGGVAARMADRLADGRFIAAFNAKGVHRALMARMPVWLVRDELLGLRGAAAIALADAAASREAPGNGTPHRAA
jgi:glucokinase